MACQVFALLTGYFSVNKRVNGKRIANLAAQQCFYPWVILVLVAAFAPQTLDAASIRDGLFPFIYGNWYCIWYIIFSFLIPYLNRLIGSLQREEHKRLACILLVIWSVIPSLAEGWFDWGLLGVFFTMYVLGSYIRLYAQDSMLDKLPWRKITFGSFAVLFGSALALDGLGLLLKMDYLVVQALHFSWMNSFVAVSCAVSLFMMFRQWNFENKWINWASTSVLGVYLIHDDRALVSLLWNTWSPGAAYRNSPWLPVHAFAKVTAVFVICMLIDKARQWLFSKTVDPKIDEWMERLSKKWAESRPQKIYTLY